MNIHFSARRGTHPRWKPFWATVWYRADERLRGDGNFVERALDGTAIPAIKLLVLCALWSTLFQGGKLTVDGMMLPQLLAYTVLHAALAGPLEAKTPASGWFFGDMIYGLYHRPMGLMLGLVAAGVADWIPAMIWFSAPALAVAGCLGIPLLPRTLWFFPSLALTISLGFAMDFLYCWVMLKLKDATYFIYLLRSAITVVFSGAILPMSMMPFGLGELFRFFPFASMAGAPLSIAVGLANVPQTILLQVFWNLVFWPIALISFRKMEERMVAYGG